MPIELTPAATDRQAGHHRLKTYRIRSSQRHKFVLPTHLPSTHITAGFEVENRLEIPKAPVASRVASPKILPPECGPSRRVEMGKAVLRHTVPNFSYHATNGKVVPRES